MPSPNVINFQTARLRALLRGTPFQDHVHQQSDLYHVANLQEKSTVADDAALVIRLVLQLSRLHGRDYHRLPQIVRVALDDMCADGSPACRLVRSWLLGQPFADQPSDKPQATPRWGDRVFRHNRFWRPGSPWLERADERRRVKLACLLTELEGSV